MSNIKTAQDYSVGELMAVAIARQMKGHDGDWAAVGAYSQLPAAGIKLARILYAPNLWWLAGGGGAINSSSKLQTSTSDHRVIRGAEYVMDMEDIVDIEMWRHNRGNEQIVAVIGGIQIDKRGSSNMVCVGDYAAPKVRGVGTVGLCFGVSFGVLYFFTMHYNRKIFVDEVDFISSPGHTADRAKYVQSLCMPPKRALCFAAGRVRLRARERLHAHPLAAPRRHRGRRAGGNRLRGRGSGHGRRNRSADGAGTGRAAPDRRSGRVVEGAADHALSPAGAGARTRGAHGPGSVTAARLSCTIGLSNGC